MQAHSTFATDGRDFITRAHRITVRALVAGDEWPEAFCVREPCLSNMRWNSKFLERFAEDLQAACELPTHDWVLAMSFSEWAPLIYELRTQELGNELKFHFLDATTVRVTEEKSNHDVVENAVDKHPDNLTQTFLAELSIKRQQRTFLYCVDRSRRAKTRQDACATSACSPGRE